MFCYVDHYIMELFVLYTNTNVDSSKYSQQYHAVPCANGK